MVIDIKDRNIECVKCGAHAVKNFTITNRGYGSMFDCCEDKTAIPVCSTCSKELDEKWFLEEPKSDDTGIEIYYHEDEIMKFIDSLPIFSRDNVLCGLYI